MTIPLECLERLTAYRWPGNVKRARELPGARRDSV